MVHDGHKIYISSHWILSPLDTGSSLRNTVFALYIARNPELPLEEGGDGSIPLPRLPAIRWSKFSNTIRLVPS